MFELNSILTVSQCILQHCSVSSQNAVRKIALAADIAEEKLSYLDASFNVVAFSMAKGWQHVIIFRGTAFHITLPK